MYFNGSHPDFVQLNHPRFQQVFMRHFFTVFSRGNGDLTEVVANGNQELKPQEVNVDDQSKVPAHIHTYMYIYIHVHVHVHVYVYDIWYMIYDIWYIYINNIILYIYINLCFRVFWWDVADIIILSGVISLSCKWSKAHYTKHAANKRLQKWYTAKLNPAQEK